MKFTYQLPNYKASLNEIDVVDSTESVVGTLQRFGQNTFIEKVARHVSATFVSNVKVTVPGSHDIYTLQLNHQIKALVSTAEWTIKENGKTIGSIKEKGVGRTLFMDLMGERVKAKAEIGSLREIKFFQMNGRKERLIAEGKRTLHVTRPMMTLSINQERTSIMPQLLAALSFVHSNQV
ncbi:tubby C-terminal domain-like protein [Alkalicoccobacillus murimartini]|uniref:Tubby C-terminal domain-containing protein n=1 Tax=Alkalicoccobacillus murimartini TaxID=171685 RepID=A0ABT9YHY2_9BACI|nr:hypothetical protein [Alkalicoccobacillus murimartini]MDQ0207471.1 hypothetical protein [Alkalicoccobacillus murimartini]